MKPALVHVLLAVVVCACARAEPAGAEPAVAAPRRVTLSVIAINDVHGRVEQLPLLGGYVSNVRAARGKDGGGTLLLDAGDIFQGTLESNLEEGAAMVAAYEALRVSAAALGNHELDFGPVGPHPIPLDDKDDPLGALTLRVKQARFPMLSANLRSKQDPSLTPVPGVERSALLWAAGVRVGIVGAMTREALTATHAANVQALTVIPLAPSIAEEAAALRKRGASLVIAVVHAGGDCQSTKDPNDLTSCKLDAEAFELARSLPAGSVDLIVGGHTHAAVAHRVAGIPIVESLSNGQAFGRVDLVVEQPSGRVIEAKIHEPVRLCKESLDAPSCAQEHYEGAAVARDQRVTKAVTPFVKRAHSTRMRPLGVEVTSTVERSSAVESPLSNLVADLMLRAFPDADVALNNGGSVRVPLPKGLTTYGHVFEVFPFDNTFATVKLSAKSLAEVVTRSLHDDHSIIALAGVRAKARCVRQKLEVQIQRPDGTVVPPDETLDVVTSDYVAMRGDGLLEGLVTQEAVTFHRKALVREALVDGLRNYASGKVDGTSLELFDPGRRRLDYIGARPVSCH